MRAHRVAYCLHYGTDPGELKVCHTCDNPACCSRDPLFLGTQRDNAIDMIRKGRGNKARGEAQHSAKLSAKDVRKIRKLRAAGVRGRVVAERFGVTVNNVSRITLHQTWRHVP